MEDRMNLITFWFLCTNQKPKVSFDQFLVNRGRWQRGKLGTPADHDISYQLKSADYDANKLPTLKDLEDWVKFLMEEDEKSHQN